jgi:putative membrane protein
MDIKGFLLRALLLTPGVFLAALLTPGIHFEDGESLFLAVMLLCLLNAFLKPLLIFFSLPFILLSLGLGVILVNAFLLWLVALLLPTFSVAGFGSALLGAFIISITSLIVLALIGLGKPGSLNFRFSINGRNYGTRTEMKNQRITQNRKSSKDEDVIDI